jgi:anti-sigma B factor antagonist
MSVERLQIVETQTDPGVAVLTLTGKAMLGAQPTAVEETITRLLAEGTRKIVVDLRGVSHIDSTGIGTFIASLGKVTQAGGVLAMTGASGMVRDAFHVTRLDRIFRFFPDVETALSII